MTLKSSTKLKVRDENRAVDPYSFQKNFYIEKEWCSTEKILTIWINYLPPSAFQRVRHEYRIDFFSQSPSSYNKSNMSLMVVFCFERYLGSEDRQIKVCANNMCCMWSEIMMMLVSLSSTVIWWIISQYKRCWAKETFQHACSCWGHFWWI